MQLTRGSVRMPLDSRSGRRHCPLPGGDQNGSGVTIAHRFSHTTWSAPYVAERPLGDRLARAALVSSGERAGMASRR